MNGRSGTGQRNDQRTGGPYTLSDISLISGARYQLKSLMKLMRFSPRQSDVMIVAGTVTYKMAFAVKRIYDQMPEPKWVIDMGACASSGGMYRSYAVLQGIDQRRLRQRLSAPS